MKYLFLLIPFFLFSNIEIKNFIFEKDALQVTENFSLKHKFGMLTAKNAIYDISKNSFLIKLKNDVRFEFYSRGILICDEAVYNSKTNIINFYSEKFIEYTDKYKNRNFKISSKSADTYLESETKIKKFNLDNISNIEFIENVTLDIEGRYFLNSDRAKVSKDPLGTILYLYPKENEKINFIFFENFVDADSANINLKTNDLYLKNANGSIKTILKKENFLNFSAKNLFWHNFEGCLSLLNNVKIEDSNFILNSNDVEFLKKPMERSIHKIISKNTTSIAFNQKDGSKSTISTNGIIEIDTEKENVFIQALKKENEYIKYIDNLVTITAKKSTVKYKNKKDIEEIILEEDVKFIYKQDEDKIGYAVADKVIYHPLKTKIELLSFGKNKVLFSQNNGSLKLSSDEIHIEKNLIKGVGDVRFTFNMEEENLLQQIFLNYM